tara:strand:+ start:15362 stop:15823 length:462 start_codon:yes stop_codon:yes gene_type:complete
MKKAIILLMLLPFACSGDQVLTYEERICALTILGEARGEKQIGMYAVACVIRKRMEQDNISADKVCLKPYQFETWSAGKGKVKKERELYYLWKSKSMMYARQLARHVCRSDIKLIDITEGADHFMRVDCNPDWIKGKKPVTIIGNHKFFRLND